MESVIVPFLSRGGDRTITWAVNYGTLKKTLVCPPFLADSTTNPKSS